MLTIRLYPHDAPDGPPIEVSAQPGQSVMQAAVAANAPGIVAECGGMMICATCHVYVRKPFAGQLPPPTEDELATLEFTAAPRRDNSRLSCQIQLTQALDGLAVDLPDRQY